MAKAKVRATNAPKFTGELARKIKKSVPPYRGAYFDLAPEAKDRYENEYINAERLRKLPLLARLYGFDDPLADHAAAVKLLLRICGDHVPGFQIASSGRPMGSTKVNVVQELLFVARFQAIRADCRTDQRALFKLMKQEPGYKPKKHELGSNEAKSKKAIHVLEMRLARARGRCAAAFSRFNDPKWRKVAFEAILAMTHEK